jgi:hypothetical protein
VTACERIYGEVSLADTDAVARRTVTDIAAIAKSNRPLEDSRSE